MHIRFSKVSWVMGVLLVLFVLSACTNNDPDSADPGNDGSDPNESITNEGNVNDVEDEEREPVTVSLGTHRDGPAEDWIIPTVEEKFPHITIEWVPAHSSNDMEDMVLAGNVPDLIHVGNFPSAENAIRLDVAANLLDYVGEYPNLAPENFDAAIMDEIIPRSTMFQDTDEIKVKMLPMNSRITSAFYNKDLFDRFGVAYPEHGLTWYDVLDYAREMNREEDGQSFWGAYIRASRFEDTAAVQYMDEDGNLTIMDDPMIEQIIDYYHQFYSIQGHYFEEYASGDWSSTTEFHNGNIALYAGGNGRSFFEEEGLNVGITTYPQWPEMPGIGAPTGSNAILLNKHSDNIDNALEVLNYLASLEWHQWLSRTYEASPHADPTANENFLADSPVYPEDAETEQFFVPTPQTPDLVALTNPYHPTMSDSFTGVGEYLDHSGYQYYADGMSVGEVLTRLEDEAATAVAELEGRN